MVYRMLRFAVGKANGIPWLPYAVCAAFNACGIIFAMFVRDKPDTTSKDKDTADIKGSVNRDSEREALLPDTRK
jgi:hypothetical protein